MGFKFTKAKLSSNVTLTNKSVLQKQVFLNKITEILKGNGIMIYLDEYSLINNNNRSLKRWINPRYNITKKYTVSLRAII